MSMSNYLLYGCIGKYLKKNQWIEKKVNKYITYFPMQWLQIIKENNWTIICLKVLVFYGLWAFNIERLSWVNAACNQTLGDWLPIGFSRKQLRAKAWDWEILGPKRRKPKNSSRFLQEKSFLYHQFHKYSKIWIISLGVFNYNFEL